MERNELTFYASDILTIMTELGSALFLLSEICKNCPNPYLRSVCYYLIINKFLFEFDCILTHLEKQVDIHLAQNEITEEHRILN